MDELTLSSALENIPALVLEQDSILAIQQYRSEWVEQKVMEQEAIRAGLDRNPEFVERVERLRRDLMIDALKESVLNEHEEELNVSREEARNYYQANRERFVLNEMFVRYRHLTARTAEDASRARQELLDGISWEEVANRYSLQPDHQIAQSERFIPVSMAFPDNPPMKQVLDVIGITEISPVRRHDDYYHFVQLLEERPEGDNPDLEWLIDQIQEWLYMEKARRFINSYRRNLYLQARANNEIELLDVGETTTESAPSNSANE